MLVYHERVGLFTVAYVGLLFVEFVANDGILIGIPDAQVREHQALVREFLVVECGKEALEFVEGAKRRIMDDGEHELFDLVPRAL
jgi:hypothetical protein